MVTLFVHTRNPEGQPRVFSFFAPLDQVLDQLSHLRQQGEAVTQAYVMDGEQRLDLPFEVFDGQSFSIPLQDLKHQWKAILGKPLSALSRQIRLAIEFDTRQIRALEHHQQLAQQALTQAHQLRHRSLSQLIPLEGSRRPASYHERVISHYKRQLTWVAQQLESTQRHRQWLCDQLAP